MATLRQIIQVTGEFSEVADFLIVYVEEAHPANEKHFKENIDINTHKTMSDRLSAAKRLLEMQKLPCPLVADRMDDAANKAYGAVPERIYIIHKGIVKYHGATGPYGYKIEDMVSWLKEFKKSSE